MSIYTESLLAYFEIGLSTKYLYIPAENISTRFSSRNIFMYTCSVVLFSLLYYVLLQTYKFFFARCETTKNGKKKMTSWNIDLSFLLILSVNTVYVYIYHNDSEIYPALIMC